MITWPQAPLYTKSHEQILISVPAGHDLVRIEFEMNSDVLWIAGPGRQPGKNEFHLRAPVPGESFTVQLDIGTRTIPEDCVEPVTAYIREASDAPVATSFVELNLRKSRQSPGFLKPVLDALHWLVVGHATNLRGRIAGILLRTLSLLVTLTSLLYWYEYRSQPEGLRAMSINFGFGFIPKPYISDAGEVLDHRFEFSSSPESRNAIEEFWNLNGVAWEITPGLGAMSLGDGLQPLTPNDGKLIVLAPGSATMNLDRQHALYDFEFQAMLHLPANGVAEWILRSNRQGQDGYRFRLENKHESLTLNVRPLKRGHEMPALVKDYLIPLSCCSEDDRISIVTKARRYNLSTSIRVAKRVRTSLGRPDQTVFLNDSSGEFRYGSVTLLGSAQYPPPAWEYVRILNSVGPGASELVSQP